MTPAPRLLRSLVLALCLLPVIAACGDPTQPGPSVPTETPDLDWTPLWDDSSASPSESASPVAITPGTLSDYLARLPKFGPSPIPTPVALPHVEGQAAFAGEIPTSQPVAFLTIDDGAVRHPLALDLIKAANVPVTLFLTTNYVTNSQDYFKALRDTGRAMIEGHTISHPSLPKLGYGDQRYQLCGATDLLEQWYGQRPTLFRPPYGEQNDDTLRAAWSCGLKAGFHWRETVDNGSVFYQRPDKTIHRGDIILMHFRPAFPEDFIIALTAIRNSGLTPALLEAYVTLAPGRAPMPQPQPTINPPAVAPPTTDPPSTPVTP